MRYAMSYKTKQFFFVLIKLSIVVGAFYFIYYKLIKNENLHFNDFITFLKENDSFSVKNIIFLLILTSFNWFFEILKWQYLVISIKKISFKSALEQSLGGLTASLITPNRIGDYGAKAMYYTKPFRKRIVLMNLLGNMAQMAITSIFGVVGLIYFVKIYQIEVGYDIALKLSIILLILGILTIFIMKHKRFNIKGYSLYKITKFIKNTPSKIHLLNLSFSVLRYLIFSFQFYYLLTLFGASMSYIEAMIIITSMYLLASVVPSISIFDVVIKGSVAVFLFSYAEVNELIVLSVSTIMWLLNFVLPSLFGSYFVLNFKLPQPETS